MADMDRRAAREIIAPLAERGETVWFSGDWGFHWYARKHGAKALSYSTTDLEVGDYIIGNRRRKNAILRKLPLEHVQSMEDEAGLKGHIMGGYGKASFYSNTWGFLPWSLGYGPRNDIDLWRVVPPAQARLRYREVRATIPWR